MVSYSTTLELLYLFFDLVQYTLFTYYVMRPVGMNTYMFLFVFLRCNLIVSDIFLGGDLGSKISLFVEVRLETAFHGKMQTLQHWPTSQHMRAFQQ